MKKVADKIVKLSSDEKLQGLYNVEEEERKLRNTLVYNAEKKGKMEIAKKMLAKGTDVNFISEVTDLSVEEINRLKQE